MAEVFSTALEDGLTSVKMMGFADISDDEIRRILSEHDCRVQDAIGAIISANESAREAKLQEDDIPAHRDPVPITSPAARPSVPSPAAEPCSTFADPEQAELVDSLTRMLLMPLGLQFPRLFIKFSLTIFLSAKGALRCTCKHPTNQRPDRRVTPDVVSALSSSGEL